MAGELLIFGGLNFREQKTILEKRQNLSPSKFLTLTVLQVYTLYLQYNRQIIQRCRSRHYSSTQLIIASTNTCSYIYITLAIASLRYSYNMPMWAV